jgi:predicted nucleic acid-binding protein
LKSYLDGSLAVLATSRLAVVEVARACILANPSSEVIGEVDRLMSSCMLVAVSSQLLRSARKLTSATIRTLDAIHLASALRIDADEMVAYDRRLIDAARERDMHVANPSAP